MSAVDEDRQADRAGTSVVDERVHRRADGSAGEKDVVHEDDHASIHGERDVGLAHDRRVADPCQIVAIERDVDRTQRDVDALVRADRRLNACGERVTPRANADDREEGKIAVTLDDLMSDPRDGPADVVRREQRGRLALLPGLTGPVLKGGGAVTKYRFDETALRWVGTVPAVG